MINPLSKTKIKLVSSVSPFIADLCFRVEHKFDNSIPTAATDGKQVLYNEEFFNSLTPAKRVGLMAHELWHIGFLHMTRKGSKDAQLWNMAGDYVINLMLTKASIEIPDNGCLDKRFDGMSTEQVYSILVKENPPTEGYDGDVIYINGDGTGEETDNIINKVINASTQVQMQHGTIPGELERYIKDYVNPKLSWNEILYRFLDSKAKDDYSWNKPNKRYMPTYLPSMYSENIGNITIAIDTSGSISQEDLSKILSEIKYIHELYNPEHMTILDCDTKIHNIYEVGDTEDILQYKFGGYGGTNFQPVIDYCNENPTNILLYFTDLYGPDIDAEPEYPLLWVCYSDKEPNKYGETIYYDS